MSEPRFKVGDRVRQFGAHNGTVHEIESVELRYKLKDNLYLWAEAELERAPEPRATVVGAAIRFQGRLVGCTSQEIARYIADGINANPEWSI